MASPKEVLPAGEVATCLDVFANQSESRREKVITELVTLVDKKQVDRNLVLDEVLAGLQRSNEKTGPFFIELHNRLSPREEEFRQRVDRYVDLISSSEQWLVSFAFAVLSNACLQPVLPLAAILSQLQELIGGSRETAVAVSALQFLNNALASCSPQEARLLAGTALYAFEHNSVEVHGLAIDLLGRFACPLDRAFATELRNRLDMISPSLRLNAELLIATADGACVVWDETRAQEAEPMHKTSVYQQADAVEKTRTAKTFSFDGVAGGDKQRLGELKAQAESIDGNWLGLAGVEQALNVVNGKAQFISKIPSSDNAVPRLNPNSRVAVIEDAEELTEMLLAGFEIQLADDDLERLLDGVSRIARPKGDKWDMRLSILRTRAQTKSGYLGALVLAWLDGVVPAVEQYFENAMHKRFIALAHQIARGKRSVILATPTHAGFWIDPRKLVERAGDSAETGILDQVQAILRLAPEHRKEALAHAQDLKGEFGRALRYALGSNQETFDSNVPLWVAAIRARHPLKEPYCMKIKIAPREKGDIARCLEPTQSLSEGAQLLLNYLSSTPMDHEMVALVGDMDIGNIKSPLCTEVYWARQFRQASDCRENGGNYWQDDGWESLFDHDMVIGGMAVHALVYGLVVSSSEARRICIDAIIQSIYDGRLDGRAVGTIIADHYQDLASARWLDALHEISAASVLHQLVVHEILETVIGSLPQPDANPVESLLEVLFRLSSVLCRGITSDTARSYLSSLECGGKSEMMAQELLILDSGQFSESLISAGMIALQQRIARATRWQSWHTETLSASAVKEPV